ncbi:hypothetical protein EMIHUDRAFT_467673, partial [Emiliania huxleyi CCMP1516]|uniref:Nuf2 DHR10-like domain-containing protein n=4 Tax=Emiliania huxleyi TaxID=2903 RepID=A0A0D3KDX5_EMIH1
MLSPPQLHPSMHQPPTYQQPHPYHHQPPYPQQHPPPHPPAAAFQPTAAGWGGSPLGTMELAAVRSQVAALAEENAHLRGVNSDLRETCSHLSSEMAKIKRAFGALSNLVDAEIEGVHSDAAKLRAEITPLKEARSALQAGADRQDAELTQTRALLEEHSRGAEEWARGLSADVETLRREAAERWRLCVEDARERSRATEELKAEVLAQAEATRVVAEYQQELREETARQREAHAEAGRKLASVEAAEEEVRKAGAKAVQS